MGVVPMVRVIGLYGVDRVSGQLNQCYWRRDWGDELEADSVLVEEVITVNSLLRDSEHMKGRHALLIISLECRSCRWSYRCFTFLFPPCGKCNWVQLEFEHDHWQVVYLCDCHIHTYCI